MCDHIDRERWQEQAQRVISFTALSVLFCAMVWAQPDTSAMRTELLDRLAGDWVMEGTIAGKHTVHDVHAMWVLHREYLSLHEVSREKDAKGGPAYEAIIYVGWDEKVKEYICLWLDNTTGGGLSADGLAHAHPAGDSIPFVFGNSPDDQIRNTFQYDRKSDHWTWQIDNVVKGVVNRFADLKLERKATDVAPSQKGSTSMSEQGSVLGIGGIFFRSAHREQTREWYARHLGLADKGQGAMLQWREHGDPQKEHVTVWTVFRDSSDYFPPGQPFMINYIVDDMDALLERLKQEGVKIDPNRMDESYGRFAWIYDLDGNKIELWQPKP